jgi:hypothetical protein
MVVAQDLAQFQDIFTQYFWLHVGFRPDRFEELLLRYQALRVLYQMAQDCKYLRSQCDASVATPQTLIRGIQPKWTKYFHGEAIYRSIIPIYMTMPDAEQLQRIHGNSTVFSREIFPSAVD